MGNHFVTFSKNMISKIDEILKKEKTQVVIAETKKIPQVIIEHKITQNIINSTNEIVQSEELDNLKKTLKTIVWGKKR